jgi:hypothetical protein
MSRVKAANPPAARDVRVFFTLLTQQSGGDNVPEPRFQLKMEHKQTNIDLVF